MTEDRSILAGELALGLLDGEERAEALRLVLADPAFAREVARWRRRFEALHGDWLEAEPGGDVERRVLTDMPGGKGVGRAWRWVAIGSSMAATALLGVVALRPSPPPVRPPAASRPAPLLVAVIQPKDGEPFAALADPVGRVIRLRGSVAVPAGRDAELWLIGGDGVPHAAGLLSPAAAGSLAVRPGAVLRAGATLAISIEPVGGSLKPVPTGPVVAKGALLPI